MAAKTKKQAGRWVRSACFLRNRAGCRGGRDTGNPRDPRSARSYLWLRATFFAPLLALCDLWAPVRVFVDFFTTCFFDELFFDLEAVERFAAISPSPLVVGSGASRIRAGSRRHPKKKQISPCSRFVAAPGSKTPRCNLRHLRRDWIKKGELRHKRGADL